MPRGDQLIRQWTLIRLLTGRIGRTLAQLANELGVTKRTVQRDLEVLTTAGFPVTSDMRNGTVFWHFMEGFHAEMPIALTLTEQMALYFSKGLFKPLQGTPMYESLESAMQKIGSQLPAQSFQFLRGLDQGISVSSFGLKDYSHSEEVLEVLTRAVFQRFTVRILHRAVHHKQAIEREVNPYKLWYVNNGLYLVGHDHRADRDALAAARAEVGVDEAGVVVHLRPEVAGTAFEPGELGVGDDLDVEVASGFDQLRRQRAHRTVVGREGLIEL